MGRHYGYRSYPTAPASPIPTGPGVQIPTGRAAKGKKILHVKLGIMDMGDGLPPWIPTPQECDQAKKDWEAVTDSDTEVIVTHFGTDVEWM